MSRDKTLEKWVTPKPSKRRNRVVIWDFDGTLFNSPEREVGENVYFEATGKMLPFPGWWGRLESLSPPIVPEIPGPEWWIKETVAAYRQAEKDENTENILMTGRPFKHRKRVLNICEQNNIVFHSYYFRGQPGQVGRDTFEIKSNFILNDILHDNLQVLEIWEDRPEHVSEFFSLSKRILSRADNLEKIIIHDVKTDSHHEIE